MIPSSCRTTCLSCDKKNSIFKKHDPSRMHSARVMFFESRAFLVEFFFWPSHWPKKIKFQNFWNYIFMCESYFFSESIFSPNWSGSLIFSGGFNFYTVVDRLRLDFVRFHQVRWEEMRVKAQVGTIPIHETNGVMVDLFRLRLRLLFNPYRT